jgi:hypothetical protein
MATQLSKGIIVFPGEIVIYSVLWGLMSIVSLKVYQKFLKVNDTFPVEDCRDASTNIGKE